MSPALVGQGQGDTTKKQADAQARVSTDPANAMDTATHDDVTATTDEISESSTQDPVYKSTPIANDMSCKEADSQPVPSTSGHSVSLSVPSMSGHTSLPRAPSRRKKSPRTRQGSTSVTVKSSVNTLDNFVSKESPSCKRKLSDNSGSPSSVQLTKTTRTDGADTIS